MTNRLTQKQRILDLLSDGNWHENGELNLIAFRYSARIYDLRRDGYIIQDKHPRGSLWAFKLVGRPDGAFGYIIREEAEARRKAEELVALDSFVPDEAILSIPAQMKEAKDPDSLRKALPFLKPHFDKSLRGRQEVR